MIPVWDLIGMEEGMGADLKEEEKENAFQLGN